MDRPIYLRKFCLAAAAFLGFFLAPLAHGDPYPSVDLRVPGLPPTQLYTNPDDSTIRAVLERDQVWEDLEALTICAVEGFAIGAGLALSLALDVRVMGESAHFRAPEVALGLSMSWGSIPRLINLVGPARAKQILILSDQRVGSADAAAWGLAQDVTPDGHAVVRALEIARAAAEMPPLTVRMTKQAVNAVANATARASIYMDTEQVILSGMTGDHKEAVAAFKEKRKPRFTGE